ncbi:DEAD/DEAH box helicase [Lyngbya aestuarii]|uniref:DEAD/DEAH box helicase n=1 Tax=Lyngbya aestuarii TaxID=118322 RepID=UPI00403D7D62
MSQQTFDRLAPFIQEYIYTHGWTELRQIQIETSRVILDTEAHLLVSAGTASGKTEAAFLPVLTILHHNPASTIGVLYISPIKALINDQFERLNDLLKEANIPVWAWHGDVSQSRKKQLRKNPQGVLQITPESLESLLINQPDELTRLFGDLRFVIIDEIHAFMGSERGSQILCQLARLSRYLENAPRRIGLSATLGDYSLAEKWLQSGTNRQVITPQVQGGQRKVQLAVEHFYLTKEEASASNPYYQYIFNYSKSRKCLIFANNRTEVELVVANLRQIAQANKLPDIYHVHHGSIATPLRQAAEEAMRETAPAVTAATVTLELGIDIGQLERVIQLNAPLSVSSFLQRLGRTGRRGSPADMRFVCTEAEPLGEELLPEQIPWQLLQCIAIIQLYLEERWIEPIEPVKYPLSLLYHQTMSILGSVGELSPVALAQQVLTLPSFAAISQEDFRQLLRYWIDIDHLQLTEKGGLIIGLTGEKVVRNFRFYAVFPDNLEYIVREEFREIGSIVMPLPAGNCFALAGKTWEAIDIDRKSKIIFVKEVSGLANTSWRSSSGSIDTKILSRMRKVLLEDTQYPYLQNQAKERLKAARQLAHTTGLAEDYLLPIADDLCCIFPWMGTVTYNTLERYLNSCVRQSLDIKSIKGKSPYFLIVKLGEDKCQKLYTEINSFRKQSLTADDLLASVEVAKRQKYDDFIPNNLLRKAFALDYLNVEALKHHLNSWQL